MTQDDSEQGSEFDQRVLYALSNLPPSQPFPAFRKFASPAFDARVLDEFARIMRATRESAGSKEMRAAVEKATRWAAIDTGAIEGLYEVERGFTFSVAAEAAAWDSMHLYVGETASKAIHDAFDAYEYVLDVATQSRPMTEAWIKELHSVICRSQATYTVITPSGRQEHKLEKGVYKRYTNNPLNFDSQSVHAYASVEDTPPEMGRLVKELNSKEFQNAHPVMQAARSLRLRMCPPLPGRKW